MSFDPEEWTTRPLYATILEAYIAAAQNLVGTDWTYSGPYADAATIGGEVSVGLPDGVELIGRIDNIEDGRMTGTIVKAQAAPPPLDDDYDDAPLDNVR